MNSCLLFLFYRLTARSIQQFAVFLELLCHQIRTQYYIYLYSHRVSSVVLQNNIQILAHFPQFPFLMINGLITDIVIVIIMKIVTLVAEFESAQQKGSNLQIKMKKRAKFTVSIIINVFRMIFNE